MPYTWSIDSITPSGMYFRMCVTYTPSNGAISRHNSANSSSEA